MDDEPARGFERIVVLSGESGQPVHDRHQRDLRLQTRERGTETEMNALAEGQMLIGFSGDIETRGIVELGFVAIGRADPRHDPGPLRDRKSSKLHVISGHTEHRLHRRTVAKHFFDGASEQVRVGLKLLPFARMLQQRLDGIPDQVRGRLVAGDQQQAAEGQDFRFGQVEEPSSAASSALIRSFCGLPRRCAIMLLK